MNLARNEIAAWVQVVIGLLALGLAYLAVAYAAHWWPFKTPVSPGPTPIPKNGALSDYNGVRIIKSWSNKTSFLLRSNEAYSLPNGGIYTCNAEYYPVQFVEHPSTHQPEQNGGNAQCPHGPLPNLAVTVRTNYLLVEQNKALHTEPIINLWLLKNGALYRVPAKGQKPFTSSLFTCLARKYLAWDFVPQGTYRHFTQAHAVAHCE
jgi:hypothetical protein